MPRTLSEYIFQWLDTALDAGITEERFWSMTLAEIYRAIKSKNRIDKMQAQERASFDYLLADLIGRSVARVYSSASKMPAIEEAYPSLFKDGELAKQIQEKQADKKAELSAIRFKLFVEAYNKKFYKEAANN